MKHSWLKSMGWAVQGLKTAFFRERNLRIHISITVLVALAALVLRIKPVEWALLFLAVGLVLVAELVNTAIEYAVDLTQEQYHPIAKRAKDVAAGAVLIAALCSIIIGFLVFGPYLFK